MDEKETNLCVAADLTTAQAVLNLAEAVGPHVCMLKTHADIIEDFSESFVEQLQEKAKKHQFLIFEDRKFADIGNTVKLQFAKGVHKIVEWADVVNCHIIPGPGIISGLQEAAQGRERGLILLAQMSSKGNLATNDYTQQAIALAKEHPEFVMGFIGNGGDVTELRKLTSALDGSFVVFTPGVKIGGGGDAHGQQYTSPADVIAAGADVIIAGRGVYQADDPAAAAQAYQETGWRVYQETRISKP